MAAEKIRPRVAAAVLSWNLRDRVIECISALLKENAVDKVILVDNLSRDDTPEAVRESFPSVLVIENDKNLGFAGGNNVGIRKAMESGADFVLIMNSDALPAEGSIARLIEAAVVEGAGAVGGKPVRRDNPAVLDAAWGVINWRNFASRLEGEGAPDGPAYSERRNVDYPLGVAMLLNVMALKEVGLFDEQYFAYHEEMELCHRMRLKGWPVIFEPARFLHGGSESLREAGAHLVREYLLARNSVRFVKKYGTAPQKIKFWIFVLAASIFKLPVEILRGGWRKHIAHIHGWLDGLRNKKISEAILLKYGL